MQSRELHSHAVHYPRYRQSHNLKNKITPFLHNSRTLCCRVQPGTRRYCLAKELNVPVIALSQLSRAVEQRPDHRPMLSDLRESGAIEQDADIVMFLYRDDYYNQDSEKKDIAEVILAKHRGGSTGTIELLWLGSYTKFVNLEKRFDD